jgi:predicted AlkP superfamily pyrophosphatase or phosphodiesterase
MKTILLILFVFFKSTISFYLIKEGKPNKLLIVSFGGVRADKFDEFVKLFPESNFNQFIENGIKAEYMEPIFPSFTFPSINFQIF